MRTRKDSTLALVLLASTGFALSTGALASAHDRADDADGAVYALTNAASGNAVAVYARNADGSLAAAGTYATGGAGTGGGISSQNAVIVSDDHRFVFAVNAGSHSVSSFRVRDHRLELVDRVASGGTTPTSVAYRSGLLYVLNAGVPNNVSGFIVSSRGKLTAIAGSQRPLSTASANPAQVGFSDDGGTLIVTERATNVIDSYRVDDDGLLSGPFVHPSAGPVPFGFAVNKRDTLLVSEAGAGGGASTYRIERDADLDPASSMIMTGQRAACWAVVTGNGRFGYVTNAGTGNISGFAIAKNGSAALLDADGVTAITGGNPTDVAMSRDSRYLYARVGALGRIAIFRVGANGSLTALPPLDGTPNLAGLTAF